MNFSAIDFTLPPVLARLGINFDLSANWLQPLWKVFAVAAGCLAVIYGLYRLMTVVCPKVAAVSYTTAKEAIAQPLFAVLMAVGVFALLMYIVLPYNTFGEDIKILKDTGLVTIMILAIILALWTASVSIAEEIEGRTALTLLSKPIGRRQFVLGKFFGILGPVALMFIVLGTIFLCSVSYKVVFDARESSLPTPSIQQSFNEIVQVTPGLVLAFLEAVVLTSISVAISTRLPMLSNLVICAAVYVLGHLVPLLVESAAGRHPIVSFVGTLIATVLPVLDHFNIQAAISTGQTVPLAYLGWTTLYCVLYTTIALLIALALFEERDLA